MLIFRFTEYFNSHRTWMEFSPPSVGKKGNLVGISAEKQEALLLMVLKALTLLGEPGREWMNISCSPYHQVRGTPACLVHLMAKPGWFGRYIFWIFGKNAGVKYEKVNEYMITFFKENEDFLKNYQETSEAVANLKKRFHPNPELTAILNKMESLLASQTTFKTPSLIWEASVKHHKPDNWFEIFDAYTCAVRTH